MTQKFIYSSSWRDFTVMLMSRKLLKVIIGITFFKSNAKINHVLLILETFFSPKHHSSAGTVCPLPAMSVLQQK